MKIRRIEILGFKSFVDKVSLEFPDGVTAIVGPNGCGKSNVVDAIRWVMGEQSAKNLRGRQMEDIIFGGSELRKPLGMAEVSLIFSTDDGRVPPKYLNYSEIQVTRRLYRDGESEYYLNKTPCRLMDISELFMDTGVGARAYSIIEQGRIGMILLSKPEDRRFLIEEAAGVTKFKARKQVAVKKIEATRQNLVRIGDIIAEIKRQLGSLQRQAKKAERFRAVREELKEIELAVAARRYLRLEEERRTLNGEVAAIDARVASLADAVAGGEVALEERRILLLEEEKAVSGAQEEIFRLKSECQKEESRLEFQKRELLNLERQAARLTEELATLERQLAESEAELRLLEDRRGEFALEAVDEEETLALKERELEDLTAAERSMSLRVEEKRRQLFGLLAEIAKFNNQQATAARRLEAMAERAERNRREDISLREKLLEAGARTAELESAAKGLAALKDALAEELQATKGRETLRKEQLVAKEQELQAKRDELNRKGSRLHSLQELEAQFAGYGQGVRTLFLADDYRKRFTALLADMIETEERFEAAVEAVLGDRLQYVVGGSDADAFAAVAYLKEKGAGRCSFVPGAPVLPPTALPSRGVPLSERVAVPEEHRHLLEPLLGRAWLVDDLAAAVAMSRECPGLFFVTLEGDVASDGGIVTGGASDGGQQGLIHKKREIKDLARDVSALNEAVREAEAVRLELKGEIGAIEESLRDLRARQHQTEMQTVHTEKDLQRSREEGQRIEERLAVALLEHDQLLEEKGVLERELADSGSGRDAGEERQRLLETEIQEENAALTEKRREIDAAREVMTVAKVRVASLHERRESTLRAVKRVENLVGDLHTRIGGHRAELATGSEERQRLVTQIDTATVLLAELFERQREAEALHVARRSRYDDQATVVREEEGRLKRVRAEVEEARKVAASQNYKLAEVTLQLNHLEDGLQEKYRLVATEVVSRYGASPGNEPEQLARQTELQRLVEEIGEVNLMAIEEYRELEERFAFLSAQKGDLEESLSSLEQAIQRINRTTRKRFAETFQQVNLRFQEIFPRLFCGGRAELRLTDPDNLLETGIDIVVQPPGKKLQNVTLLSGGEKALTAVALIFSIFLIKPSPFCLLDEVDAPLDDANIGRFNDMIREMTAFSQFILITHSKTTMAVADTLYGVTMEEPGVSKLVSVRLN